MAGGTPLSEENQALMFRLPQEGFQIGTMQGQPGCQS